MQDDIGSTRKSFHLVKIGQQRCKNVCLKHYVRGTCQLSVLAGMRSRVRFGPRLNWNMSTSACTGNVDMWYGIRGPIRRISNIIGNPSTLTDLTNRTAIDLVLIRQMILDLSKRRNLRLWVKCLVLDITTNKQHLLLIVCN